MSHTQIRGNRRLLLIFFLKTISSVSILALSFEDAGLIDKCTLCPKKNPNTKIFRGVSYIYFIDMQLTCGALQKHKMIDLSVVKLISNN